MLRLKTHSLLRSINILYSPNHRGYRTFLAKNRYYGPTPSDVAPQLRPQQDDTEDEGQSSLKTVGHRRKSGDGTNTKSVVKSPAERKQAHSERMSDRQVALNQRLFMEFITTGLKKTLEPFIYEDIYRFRFSVLGHRVYFPTLTYKAPNKKSKKSIPVYNILALLSVSVSPPHPTPHPFACRTLPTTRKLKRLKDEEADPRLGQFGIKVYFEKPVVCDEDHDPSAGMWIPVGDPILLKALKIYDSFEGAQRQEVDETCIRYYDKYVVQNENVPVTW